MNQTTKAMDKKTTTIRIAGLDTLLYTITLGAILFITKEALREYKKFKEGK